MGKFIDEKGNRYGKLVVLGRAGKEHGRDQVYWHCRCDCGSKVVVGSRSLRNGRTRSCGCLSLLPKGVAAFNKIVSTMKHNARARDLEWQLTDEQVRCLTKQVCHYCGAKPSQISRGERINGTYIYNGLDRVDNDRGYTIDNVVSCCFKCNRSKGTQTVDEFRSWVIELCKHFVNHR